MYSLSKGVISKYIRGECKRRLRLDLYEGKAARVADEAVEKDARRPGLTLLSEQGRSFERQCFRELDGIFGHQVIRGDFAEYQEGEERALTEISFLCHVRAMLVADNRLGLIQRRSRARFADFHGHCLRVRGADDIADLQLVEALDLVSRDDFRLDTLRVAQRYGSSGFVDCHDGRLRCDGVTGANFPLSSKTCGNRQYEQRCAEPDDGDSLSKTIHISSFEAQSVELM